MQVSDVDTLDITDREATLALLRDAAPDVVCHLAGLTGANDSLKDPRRFYEVNCDGTLNVLEACRQAEIGGFVFMSSLTVHGQSGDAPVDEDSPFQPRHPYSGSKAAAEIAVQNYARCYGLRAASLRATLICGEGQAEPNAITEFIDTVQRGEAIDIYGDGAHRREWLHPLDLAMAVVAAIDHVAAATEPMCEAYIVSPGEAISMADLARRVIEVMGKGELVFTPSNRQAFNLCTSAGKVRELGWEPKLTVDDMIRRVLKANEVAAGGVAEG